MFLLALLTSGRVCTGSISPPKLSPQLTKRLFAPHAPLGSVQEQAAMAPTVHHAATGTTTAVVTTARGRKAPQASTDHNSLVSVEAHPGLRDPREWVRFPVYEKQNHYGSIVVVYPLCGYAIMLLPNCHENCVLSAKVVYSVQKARICCCSP